MTSQELKTKYLEFFKSKNHAIIPSASLVPENDPTVLFTTAGMHPLVPYLLGEKHPMGNRLVNCQKCIRVDDIEEVGDESHLTFFNMLGNWSLGDYWKQEAIAWALEFLTQKLEIRKSELEITCFAGDKNAPRDDEAAEIWRKLGINKIKFLPKKDNWWGPAGQTGPCGPDSEIFWKGIEIWNLVFMQYNKNSQGEYKPLEQKNIDTGMGFARVTALLNNKNSVFETDLFYPGIKTREQRIVADHVRAAVFAISDGAEPSNLDRGYIVRKLIRRAMRYEKNIAQIAKNFTQENKILQILQTEQKKFQKTLERGLKEIVKNKKNRTAFEFYQSYGLPLEVIQEYMKVNKQDFEKKLKQHQEASKSKKFKAGLQDHQEQTVKLHTATHLLLSALRQILDKNIKQAGSNITPERLRFDFTWPDKLTPEQIKQVENLVNQKIQENLPITCCEMELKKAEKTGALATFKGRYPDIVRVYTVGDKISCEICAGPHVKNTRELGKFKITKQESSSAGVRRIRGVLG